MHLKDFGLLNYPCGPSLIGVLDFHPVEFRVWGSFSFLALIFVCIVIFFVSSHFQFLLASIWAFCPYTLGGPLEPPTSLQPPDHHHRDHLMAHYRSGPSISTGTVVTQRHFVGQISIVAAAFGVFSGPYKPPMANPTTQIDSPCRDLPFETTPNLCHGLNRHRWLILSWWCSCPFPANRWPDTVDLTSDTFLTRWLIF